MPFADASFDLIIDKCTSDTLLFRTSKRHYVGELLVRLFFAESYRVLSPSGVLAIVTPKKLVKGLHDKEQYRNIAPADQPTGVKDGKLQPRPQLRPFAVVTASEHFPFAKVKKFLVAQDGDLPSEFHKHKGYLHLAFKEDV